MANIMVTDDDRIIVWALQGGFLQRALYVLNCAQDSEKITALWALSNITSCKSKDLIKDVLLEEALIERVI